MQLRALVLFTGLLSSLSIQAQSDPMLLEAFAEWIASSAYEISASSIESSTADLAPVESMLGDARIIGLSESLHSAAEPVKFRNSFFAYLVEELNFKAIVIESGVTESKVLNDYAIGLRDDFEYSVLNGLSNRFDQFQGNHQLLRWIRGHNDALPPGTQKVQIFGMDVSGSPPGLIAIRKPDTPLRQTLDFLQQVDEPSAEEYRLRIEPFLPALASGNDYGMLTQADRDRLSATIEDMISLIGRRKLEYQAASSEYEYLWAERIAIAARQTDSWFRRMPLEWTPSGDYEWTSEAQNIRDRIMVDNVNWVLHQLNSTDRILVFASVNHIAAEQHDWPLYLVEQGQRQYGKTPLGYYLKASYGEDFKSILNLVGEGAIKMCFRPDSDPIPMEAPQPDWIEAMFDGHSLSEYMIDLGSAPEPVAGWLSEVREQRNARISASGSFDIVYYIAEFSHDCI